MPALLSDTWVSRQSVNFVASLNLNFSVFQILGAGRFVLLWMCCTRTTLICYPLNAACVEDRFNMSELHENVIRALEAAGRTLMMLPMPKGGMPQGDSAAWPDILQNYWDLAGHADEGTVEERQHALAQDRNRTKLHATRKGIQDLDTVLNWLWYIQTPKHRRIVAARMLMHPDRDNDKHVKTYRKLAQEWGVTEWTVRDWHDRGITAIVQRLALDTSEATLTGL